MIPMDSGPTFTSKPLLVSYLGWKIGSIPPVTTKKGSRLMAKKMMNNVLLSSFKNCDEYAMTICDATFSSFSRFIPFFRLRITLFPCTEFSAGGRT
jgi:hypothetical protein